MTEQISEIVNLYKLTVEANTFTKPSKKKLDFDDTYGYMSIGPLVREAFKMESYGILTKTGNEKFLTLLNDKVTAMSSEMTTILLYLDLHGLDYEGLKGSILLAGEKYFSKQGNLPDAVNIYQDVSEATDYQILLFILTAIVKN